MSNYSTLGSNMKRGIFNFCEKISFGFFKPAHRFITEMIYGILAGQSCFLTEIARKLKEGVALDKTVERLSRNLMSFDEADRLWENYFEAVKGNFDENTVLIVDDSDISKPCSSKLEGLCKVRDGSTGEITDGYWFAGVSALSAQHRQPIPVYSRVYSSAEKDYVSNNAETLKSLFFCRRTFQKQRFALLIAAMTPGTFLTILFRAAKLSSFAWMAAATSCTKAKKCCCANWHSVSRANTGSISRRKTA